MRSAIRKRWRLGLAVLILGLLIYAAHPWYLAKLGHFFIVSDALVKADIIIVLARDSARDERLLHAIKLWQEGYAPKIALSATLADWQNHEDFPTWRHATKLNILPKESLLVLEHEANSTSEEAQSLLPYVREHQFKEVIIVTSNYHTRRSKMSFRSNGRAVGFRSLFQPLLFIFHPDSWWKHRSDSRTLFLESTKMLWYVLFE